MATVLGLVISLPAKQLSFELKRRFFILVRDFCWSRVENKYFCKCNKKLMLNKK